MNPSQLSERRQQALRDLEDVARQTEAGELNAETAAQLEATYTAEAARAGEQLAELALQPATTSAEGRSPRRAVVGTVAMLLAVGAILFFVSRSIEDRPDGGFVTGNVGRDLSEVTNAELEDVVAENPDVVDMRLALANRYVEENEYSAALPHFMAVLDRQPDHPAALANLGWITFLSNSGEDADETAARLLERSLAAAPGYPDALFFLANVRLYGLDDPQGATELLDELTDSGTVPDYATAIIERMLAEAEAEERRASQ